ncbi:hypothetical protein FBU59_005523 [Linderina macrospora]|uniref:Uncharacterized protein n=1 Tax=Linderina macrospora TaxID=4868 RepID=A0ACC1J2K1_9FUNG|nr:hypothetical protein FBU59_005523 [Linderina macrospora]
MTALDEKVLRNGLFVATQAGYAVLHKGGSALDAVEAAVRSLENNPLFNAGKGAVFNRNGTNQLEASIMEGHTGRAGAATQLTVVKNPITLAKHVMDSDFHVFLANKGAEDFAQQQGLDIVDPSYFWTKHRWEQHERGFFASNELPDSDSTSDFDGRSSATTMADEPADYSYLPLGTVGAVALDSLGHLATATSTGGMTNKWDGRIGDTPIIGAGTWADTKIAVSSTGSGEYFIRQGTARYISLRHTLASEPVDKACETAIREVKVAGGDGGVIAIDSQGRFTMTFGSDGMYRAYCSAATDHEPVVGIFGNEVIAAEDHHIDVRA